MQYACFFALPSIWFVYGMRSFFQKPFFQIFIQNRYTIEAKYVRNSQQNFCFFNLIFLFKSSNDYNWTNTIELEYN